MTSLTSVQLLPTLPCAKCFDSVSDCLFQTHKFGQGWLNIVNATKMFKKEFLETVQTNFDRNLKVSFHLTAESDNMIAAAEH